MPNFASECAIGLEVAVLGGYFDVFAENTLKRNEVDRRRGNDNLFRKINTLIMKPRYCPQKAHRQTGQSLRCSESLQVRLSLDAKPDSS